METSWRWPWLRSPALRSLQIGDADEVERALHGAVFGGTLDAVRRRADVLLHAEIVVELERLEGAGEAVRTRWCDRRASIRVPSSSTAPEALAKPVMASTALVLPAPFGPMSPTMPPAGTRNDTSSTATTPPYWTVTCSTSSTTRCIRSGRDANGRDRRLGGEFGVAAAGSVSSAPLRRLAPRREPVRELVAAGGESLGVADEGHDHEHAADDHEHVAAEVDPLGGEVEDDAAGGDDARRGCRRRPT